MSRMLRRLFTFIVLLSTATGARGQQETTATQPATASTQPAPAPSTQAAGSAPAASRPAADEQRLNDLLTLIEGPSIPLAARRTGARELLRQNWAETPPRLALLLAGQNATARLAVALALADVPQHLDPAYVDPLIQMLESPETELREAAAAALAGYRDTGVTPRLRDILLDESRPMSLRLAAVEALGLMTQRDAVAALIQVLENPDSPLVQPALRAIENITAVSFPDELAGVERWWAHNAELSPAEWKQAQIERLIQRNRGLLRRVRELEARLVDAYRTDYLRAPESQRPNLLQTYLADTTTLVRLLGLELVQQHLGDGRSLAPEVATQIRALLTDTDHEVRAAAVQAVARLRDNADAARFLELLALERQPKVRRALVNALGYLGGENVIQPLLDMLASREEPASTEAVAALGRLAERAALPEQWRTPVADALLTVFEQTEPSDVALRERVVWAMSLIRDPRFAEVFALALEDQEDPAVRQSAIRGILELKNPSLTNALLPVTAAEEASLRGSAVAALAELASTDEHLLALWTRLDPARESEEVTRRAAWQGVLRVLANRPPDQVRPWVERLPAQSPQRRQWALDLYRLLVQKLQNDPARLAELGRFRARMADELAATGQKEEAIAAYLAALADLHQSDAEQFSEVAAALLRLALLANRYDTRIASALANGNPTLDGEALWRAVQPDLAKLLVPEEADRLVAALQQILAQPPAAFSPALQEEITAMLESARALQDSTVSRGPATQAAPVAP